MQNSLDFESLQHGYYSDNLSDYAVVFLESQIIVGQCDNRENNHVGCAVYLMRDSLHRN
jgi:hypothetical protein